MDHILALWNEQITLLKYEKTKGTLVPCDSLLHKNLQALRTHIFNTQIRQIKESTACLGTKKAQYLEKQAKWECDEMERNIRVVTGQNPNEVQLLPISSPVLY